LTNERFRDEMKEVFDGIAGAPSSNLSQHVRSALVLAPKTRDHFWIAAVAAVMITALLVGVLVATRPHSRTVPGNPHVASPARTDPCPVADNSVPSPRTNTGMVFDAKHGYVLMFGGSDWSYCTRPGWVIPPDGRFAVTNETWKWDGTRWTLLHPAKSPSPRSVRVMAYDPNSQRVILLNGGTTNADPPIHDMWAWDGTTWTELKPAKIPTWCPEPYVTDRDLSVILLIACNPTLQPDFGHVWEWSGSEWTYATTAGSVPPQRFGFAFAYDPDHHQEVFQGGWRSYAPGDVVKDIWLLTNRTWSQSQSTTPSPEGGYAVYDESRHQLVLVTGDSSAPLLLVTWTWDGKSWTLHKPGHRPPGGSMAYDARNRQVTMFGGQRDSKLLNETWAWNGEDWVQLG
jgi:hypothetical protein